MTLTLKRNPKQPHPGCTDSWFATIPGFRPGIGKTRVEAMGSLMNANLEAFGITERVDIDPTSVHPALTWQAYNR